MHALIIEDHPLLAQSLVLELKRRAVAEVTLASSLAEGISALRASAAISFVLLDLKLPDAKGLAALRAIRLAAPNACVAVMSGEDITPEILSDVISLGATTFIPKGFEPERFDACLSAAIEGRKSFPIARVLEMRSQSRSLSPAITRREVDVLNELTLGKSNKEIARALGLAEATVKRHLESIFSKLDVTRRSQAILRARELGIAIRQYQ